MKKNTLKGMNFSSLRAKLMSTVAMLLVASTLLVTSSYAWFVMSTAPEVTGIDTQVGANGALEIALRTGENGDVYGDFDENATGDSDIDANNTWGNLVNLGDAKYGLNQITLLPSRLFIEEAGIVDGVKAFSVNELLLKTPIYGEDGRVKGLDKESTANLVYNAQKASFDTEGIGVRAVGTAADMSVYQLGMNAAKAQLSTYTSAARTTASNTLNQNGNGVANIVLGKALEKKTDGFAEKDLQTLLELAKGLQASLKNIETALRYVFAGYLMSDASGDKVTAENYQTLVAEVQTKPLNELLNTYNGITSLIPGMDGYVNDLLSDQTKVNKAVTDCGTLVEKGTAATWTEINSAMSPLVDYTKMKLGDKSVPELEKMVAEGKYEDILSLVSAGGLTLYVPSKSGVLSDIADYAGDYTAKVKVDKVSAPVGGKTVTLTDVDVTMRTQTGVQPVYLTNCSNALNRATVRDADGSSAITDFYGYAIDLAFRTNATKDGKATSSLLLQTEPENRVYEGDGENAVLQGGGSYMLFRNTSGLSATKMLRLMSGIRVVFIDGENNLLGIAALDTTVSQRMFTELSDEEKGETKMFAYLDGWGDHNYQISDMVDVNDYGARPTESSVVFSVDNGTKTIKAKLYMYDFDMDTRGEDGEKHLTGGISLAKTHRESRVITTLTPDQQKNVTALVYLDGKVVDNSSVAANASQSMSGTLNLQFSSDATLMPAEITSLRQGEKADGGTGN